MVILWSIGLLVVPTTSSETISQDALQSEPVVDERNKDNDERWIRTDIEDMLNIYGPTSAGYPRSKESGKAIDTLPYVEMGVNGVEYQNFFIDQHFKGTEQNDTYSRP